MTVPDHFGIVDPIKRLTAPAGLEAVHQDGYSWARQGEDWQRTTRVTPDEWNALIAQFRGLLTIAGVDLTDIPAGSPMLLKEALMRAIAAGFPAAAEAEADTIATALMAIPAFMTAMLAAAPYSASALTTGTLADARLPARLTTSGEVVTDWNNAVNTGFYRSARQIDGIANTPNGATAPQSTDYWTGTVTQYNPSYMSQILTGLLGERWERWKQNGVWQAWRQLNVSMAGQDARYARLTGGAFSGSTSAPYFIASAAGQGSVNLSSYAAPSTGIIEFKTAAGLRLGYMGVGQVAGHLALVVENGVVGYRFAGGNVMLASAVGANAELWLASEASANKGSLIWDRATNDIHLTNSTTGRILNLAGDSAVYYAGVKIINADGTLVSSFPAPTAGDVVVNHAVSEANAKSGADGAYREVARFIINRAGTVRARATHFAVNGTQYVRILKNGVQQGEWTTTGSVTVERTVDIVVAAGDDISYEAKYTTYAGSVWACRLSSGVFTSCADGGA